MNPYPDITPLLKALRLSGVLETVELGHKEAIEHQLPYGDFLSLVLQDEITRRENTRFTQRLKKSNIRPDKTLERFDFSVNPTIN